MSNQLQPPTETGGGLIMWLLGAVVMAIVLIVSCMVR